MASLIKAVTFDCSDAIALATFWAAALGTDVDEDGLKKRGFERRRPDECQRSRSEIVATTDVATATSSCVVYTTPTLSQPISEAHQRRSRCWRWWCSFAQVSDGVPTQRRG